MSINYTPVTHFFADPTQLADSASANYATDAFGPIDTNSYRTTSKVRSLTETTLTKVYAICAGRILIQPQTGDDTKINIILKPEGPICTPLKIKYFVYRGVRKSDWIDIDNLKPKNLADNDQSPVLQRLWDEYIKSKGAVVPINFPAASIGYDKTPLTANPNTIDHALNFIPTANLPTCVEGELIGNFSGSLGLDIVLDDGDYQLENQEELFKFDLAFARSAEHIFDITNIQAVVPQNPEIDAHNVKRYREYIHRFIDAAAFWGSHIECGAIKLFNNAVGLKTNSEIFDTILVKYQSKNKIYIYIRSKRGRSYNYFFYIEKTERQVKGFNGDQSESYSVNGWPILIKEIGTPDIVIGLQYSIDYNTYELIDRHVTVDIIAPNNDAKIYPLTQYNIAYRPPAQAPTVGNMRGIPITFPIYKSKSCASFLFIFGAFDQDFPLANYYDDLWLANINTNLNLPPDSNDLLYWSTYDKNRILNINGILSVSASVQNQTVFDTGTSITTPPSTKKRRLSIAIIKETDNHSKFKKLKINDLKAAFSNEQLTATSYSAKLYNDEKMSLYRGRIVDGNTPVTTLSLVHDEDFEKKFNYFHLGITDDEHHKLTNELINPIAGSKQLPFKYADNVFFYLKEVAVSGVYFRKFIVGLKYEDGTGEITIFYPSQNSVYVYTIDGFYFFSPDYSAHQKFCKEFSSCNVGFRPKSDKRNKTNNWIGEFGFDWVRVGDTELPVDPKPSNDYLGVMGHYYHRNAGGVKVGPGSPNPNSLSIKFIQETAEWIKFSNSFSTYPSGSSLYSSGCLTIYPSKDTSGIATVFPKKNSIGSDRCLTEAGLDLVIDISVAPSKLQIKFETTFFEIVPLTATDLLPVISSEIGYSYLEIVNKSATPSNPRILKIILRSLNEFTINKTIRVLADDKLAGELIINANEKQFRKEIKVMLVNVFTIIDGSTANNGFDIPKSPDPTPLIQENISRLFNQALIDVVDFSKSNLDVTKNITLSSGTIFNFNKSYVDFDGTASAIFNPKKTITSSIQQDLYDAYFSSSTPEQINALIDYFFVFYINEDAVVHGATSDTHTNGAGLFNSKIVCVYRTGITIPNTTPIEVNDTSGHELLHATGLNHTFSDANSFTFEQFKTDNIMDYYVDGSGKKRYTLSRYQKEIIVKHTAVKPEA